MIFTNVILHHKIKISQIINKNGENTNRLIENQDLHDDNISINIEEVNKDITEA